MNVSEWIDTYTTQNTRDAAKKSHIAWTKYLDFKNINESELIHSMKTGDEDQRYDELSKFVNDYPKFNPVQPASIRQYYNFVRAYFRRVHGIKTDSEEAKIFVKSPSIIKINREPLTKEIIQRLCKESDDIHKAEYLVLASSGMRISELLSLKQEDYDFNTLPVKVHISGKNTKTKAERTTFISKEAVEAIEDTVYGFWEPRELIREEVYFNRLRRKIGLVEKYDNSINYKYVIHSFRAFFRTAAGEINQDFAEKMLGHAGYLTQYIRLTDEKKAEYYQKLEPKLTIFPVSRKKK